MELLSKVKIGPNALVPIRTVVPEWVGSSNRTSKLVCWRHVVNLVDWVLQRTARRNKLINSIDVNLVSNAAAISEGNAMFGTREYCDKQTGDKQKTETRYGRAPYILPNVTRTAGRHGYEDKRERKHHSLRQISKPQYNAQKQDGSRSSRAGLDLKDEGRSQVNKGRYAHVRGDRAKCDQLE